MIAGRVLGTIALWASGIFHVGSAWRMVLGFCMTRDPPHIDRMWYLPCCAEAMCAHDP